MAPQESIPFLIWPARKEIIFSIALVDIIRGSAKICPCPKKVFSQAFCHSLSLNSLGMHDSNYFNAVALKIPAAASAQSDFWAFAKKQTAAIAHALLLNPQSAWIGASLGILLVSVPVFFEAPLVRTAPWLGVLLTGGWIWASAKLRQHPQTTFVGDLLTGLSWSWLAGAIYWGWFRWEPLWHIPIEAMGLPVALWGLHRGQSKVGHWFYLGSLLGTAITDVYFYRMELMPYWRQLMVAAPAEALDIVQAGFSQIQTAEGAGVAAMCALVLLALAWQSWRSPHRHFWVFSGTLIGTLLVDSLFVVLASL